MKKEIKKVWEQVKAVRSNGNYESVIFDLGVCDFRVVENTNPLESLVLADSEIEVPYTNEVTNFQSFYKLIREHCFS